MRPFLSPHRCPRCEIRRPLCFCSFIPQLNLATRVTILMHTSEEQLTSNTARLAAKALVHSEVRIHGRRDQPMSGDGLTLPNFTSLVLFPSSRALELTPEFVAALDRPVHLIVPDANWRQTTKFARQDPAIAGIRQVKLPLGAPSEYALRTQRDPSNLCTLEAIARAIGCLESREAQAVLEKLLGILVERTLWSRGQISAKLCTIAGIPSEAMR